MSAVPESPTLTAQVLDFALHTRFEDLPAVVVHEAKRYVLDAIGCVLGGHAVPKGRLAAAHAQALGGPPEAAVIGGGAQPTIAAGVPQTDTVGGERADRTPSGSPLLGATAAAFANAELINALDHDSLPHVVPVSLPAVLAAAQSARADGRALIAATVVAHEIGQRLGRASSAMIRSLADTGSTPEAFGICNEALVGGALGAARLLALDREQAGHALGLAAYFCSLPVARDWEEAVPKSLVKYTPVGLMAQNGLTAALLARSGFTGNPQVLDAQHGLRRFLGTGVWEPAAIRDGLGTQWLFLDQQYKPWPCCRFFHSQLDLIAQLVDAHHLAPAQVAAIDCHGPRFVANPRTYDTRTHVDVQFSLPFCVALVMHRIAPDARWQHERTLARSDLHAFVQKVRMHADPRSMAGKRRDPRSWYARVRIALADGRVLEAETEHARGTNRTAFAMDDAALEAKFRMHAGTVLAPAAVDAVVATLWELDRLPDSRALAALLSPA